MVLDGVDVPEVGVGFDGGGVGWVGPDGGVVGAQGGVELLQQMHGGVAAVAQGTAQAEEKVINDIVRILLWHRQFTQG